MLESKMETERHNLKIKMDKNQTILSKQINLHVSDIQRYQGCVSKLGIEKGKNRDELLRLKERSRKTNEQIKRGRMAESTN